MVSEYESASEAKVSSEDVRHHEQTYRSQKSFSDKVQKLYGVIKDLGNPFQEESRDLLALDSKAIAHPSAAELVGTHLEKGKVSFKEFFNGLGNEASFYKPIKKNKTDFFCQESASGKSDRKKQMLKDDCRLFSQLFISCQSRECDLLEFLSMKTSLYLQHLATQESSTSVRSLRLSTFWKLLFLLQTKNQNVMPSLLMGLLLFIHCLQRHQ